MPNSGREKEIRKFVKQQLTIVEKIQKIESSFNYEHYRESLGVVGLH